LSSFKARRLRQVTGNLLTNALRHTPPEGEIAVVVWQSADCIRLSVTNTGRQFSADEMQQVFLPFWRTSTAREHDTGGSGLGLAISKQLIELHRGKMWIESSQTRVSFVFDLPIR
jgi:two-component system sensor histidine kinase BaeS